MKKTIGILTFHRAHNYGACLQSFALCKVLNVNKYKAEIIDYYEKNIYNHYKIIKPPRKNFIKGFKIFLQDMANYNDNKKRYINFEEFIKVKYKLSKRYNHNLEAENLQYDILITGSDQVWNKNIVRSLSNIYTLNFSDDKTKRISYAASIGDVSLIKNNKAEYKDKLSKLDFISVRENDAAIELKKLLLKDIKVNVDPTLLLKKDDWLKEISHLAQPKENYLLAYVVEPDDEYIKIVNYLSEKTGLGVIHFGLKNPGYKNVIKSAYTEGPLEFINYIKDAKYIVTTSFHATVFSILFNNKFFVIPHKKTGSRVTNLLELLNIKGRTFYKLEDFKKIDYDFITDWKEVNKNLELERKKSTKWLIDAIEK